MASKDGHIMKWKEIRQIILNELETALETKFFQAHYQFARIFAVTKSMGHWETVDFVVKEILNLDATASAHEIALVPTIYLMGRNNEPSYRRFQFLHLRYQSLTGIHEEMRSEMAKVGFYKDDHQKEGTISCHHCHDDEIIINSTMARTLRRHAIENPECKITNEPWNVLRKKLPRIHKDENMAIINAILVSRDRRVLELSNEEKKKEISRRKIQQAADRSAAKTIEKTRQRKFIPKTEEDFNIFGKLDAIAIQINEAKEKDECNPMINDLSEKINSLIQSMDSRRCVSCMSKEATVVQLPCLHKILCISCHRRRHRVRTSRKDPDNACDMCKSPIALATATYPKD